MDALIADDHEIFSNALLWALQKILPGWDIQKTDNGRTAMYVLTMDPGIKFAVVDYLLPRMHGDEAVSEAVKLRPHLRGKIIICSGMDDYDDDIKQRLFVELGCRRLDKGNPEFLRELERLVHEIVGPHHNAE